MPRDPRAPIWRSRNVKISFDIAKAKQKALKQAEERAKRLAEKVVRELKRVVGVQARTRITKSGRVVAVDRATPGAPPRRVTGRGQESIDFRVTKANVIFGAVWYMLHLEKNGHPWLRKTIAKVMKESR